MKLGFVLPGFSASEADWCIPVFLNLVRALARDHEVHVFALRYPYERRTYTVYGATVHALGGATARGLRRVPLLVRAVRAVVAEARRRRFDVLHGIWADEPGLVAVAAGRMLRTPAVVTLGAVNSSRCRTSVTATSSAARRARWSGSAWATRTG
ncbi:MAG: glycosyltransferase family 4 protein [Anaerolineae bacterium]|nr:glycosyltransferase family 4 protein [Anaerolineae bacterium]